jgi:antitoxin YefM
MTTISYTEARANLATVWDETLASRDPVVISRRGSESVVLVALDEWNGLLETAHLLRSPANARRLLGALQRLNQGEGLTLTQAQLHEHTLAR